MAAPWEKVNPDNAVDRLPQPYRLINKILEDLLEAVGDQVGFLESQKRSADHEFGLKQVPATSAIQVAGRVASAYADARGTNRFVVGSSRGEVMLVDAQSQHVIASKHAFGEHEAVHCVSLCSDGCYKAPLETSEPPLRPRVKLLAAGTTSSRILVYDISKEEYGVVLRPACAITVPQEDSGAAGSDGAPLVEQLHTVGTSGGIWVVTLLRDRTVQAYLCPLGEPAEVAGASSEQRASVISKTIKEDEEEEVPADASAETSDEFASVTQVNTPLYSFALPGLAPAPGLPEPSLGEFTLTAFTSRPTGNSLSRHVAGQTPLFCYVSSTASNVVVAYSIQAPVPAVAPEGLDADALLKEFAPPPGTVKEATTTSGVVPRRRWALPARTSAVAVSPNGGMFAVGGARGALALVNAAEGPSLRTMLPGHYAAVEDLSFYRTDMLVSVGADSWVHHYCTKTDTLLVRYLCSPPPSQPPARTVAACQIMPLALSLDAKGGMRLLDLKSGRKVARAVCHKVGVPEGGLGATINSFGSGDEQMAAGMERQASGESDGMQHPIREELPRRLLVTARGFVAVCEAAAASPTPGPAEDEGENGAGADGTAPADSALLEDPDHLDSEISWLVFFDLATMMRGLFPGLVARAGEKANQASLADLFMSLSPEELEKAPPAAAEMGSATRGSTAAKRLGRKRTTTLGSSSPKGGSGGGSASISFTALPAAEAGQPLSPKPPSQPMSPKAAAAAAGKAGATADNAVAKLTEENLRRMGRTSKSGTLASLAPSEGVSMLAGAPAAKLAGLKAPAHAVTENWQVAVRRCLRSSLGDREVRQRRLQKRMDQLRKEIGGDA